MTMEMTIPEFFKGKNVFVTGGTGFVGKVLVEKLLRSCPDLGRMYILIRDRKGKSAEERWKAITELPLFELLRTTTPLLLDKVTLIRGDIYKDDLSLNDQDKQIILDNVDIIYHAAASIQFTEDLLYSFRQNTCGTYNVAELAKSMKKLKCFIHVSTAFSNSHLPSNQVKEELHPVPLDWKVIKKLEQKEGYNISLLRNKLMCDHPVTYTLTKNLAEQVMKDYSQYYPVLIVRPAVVISSLEDPIAGWVDLLNGLGALLVAAASGVLRTIYGKPESRLDYVCVDHAVKAFIISTWEFGRRNRKNGIEIVHCNYGKNLTISSSYISEFCLSVAKDYPVEEMLWYPWPILMENRLLLRIAFFFLQIIPAFVVDCLLKLFGKKPRLIEMTILISQAVFGSTSNFSCAIFCFPNEKFSGLPAILHEKDKEAFFYALDKLNDRKEEILLLNIDGSYRYHMKLKMDEKSIEERKKKFQRFKILHYGTLSAFAFVSLMTVFNTFIM